MGLSGTSASPSTARTTTEDLDLRALRVNELGVVPVLMYHAFTTNPTTDMWTRSLDDFWGDLTWLYENNFAVISVNDLITNSIAIPAGKHPVILTFDDSPARQFQFTTDAEGQLVPSTDTAVGTLEAFFTAFPDFGRGGHFAVVGNLCFAFKSDADRSATWEAECGQKLQWLSDHGYEVGNHTWSHPNLGLLDAAGFEAEVGGNAAFIDALMDGPGNHSDMLTLPFGKPPAAGTVAESSMIRGFAWQAHTYAPKAIIRVEGGPTPSPSSTRFTPMAITRFNTDPVSLDNWFGKMERREIIVYTSDGNPDTIAVPDPVPAALAAEFDPTQIEQMGKTLLRFADDGLYQDPPLTALPPLKPGVNVVTCEQGVRVRETPSTAAVIERRLRDRSPLTVLDGPVKAEGYTWWLVRTDDGTDGWVVEDFLAGPPT